MAKAFSYFVIGILLWGCTPRNPDHNPDTQLTPREKDRLMTKVIRYLAKAPENVNETEKFASTYNEYYLKKASEAKLEQYFKEGDEAFFLITQPAPSLIEKRNATAGKLKLNDAGELIEYEEIFRTWKMTPDTLKARSYFLFDKIVSGESLEPYYTKNSNGVDYIEFPDDRTYYDKNKREWIPKQ